MTSPTGRILPTQPNLPLHSILPGTKLKVIQGTLHPSWDYKPISFPTPLISTLDKPLTAEELSTWLGPTICAPWTHVDLLTTATVMLARFLGRHRAGIRLCDYKINYEMAINVDPDKLMPSHLRELDSYFKVQNPEGDIPFILKTPYIITRDGVFFSSGNGDLEDSQADMWSIRKRICAKRIRFQAVREILQSAKWSRDY